MSIEDRATQLAVAVIAKRAAVTAAEAVAIYREIVLALTPAHEPFQPIQQSNSPTP